MCVGQQYPTLSCSIPVYNFLLDKLEDEYDMRKNEEEEGEEEDEEENENEDDDDDDENDDEENGKTGNKDKIAVALNQSIEKLKQYYVTTGGLIYTVATGKFDYLIKFLHI